MHSSIHLLQPGALLPVCAEVTGRLLRWQQQVLAFPWAPSCCCWQLGVLRLQSLLWVLP